MLRDITLGQYYPVDSLLHRLDPRTKLFGTLVYIVTLFIADNIWAYLAATIFLITAIKLSNVPVKFMVRGLKSIMFLLLLSVSFNLFLTPGTPIFKIGFLQMTWEGLRFAAFMAIRLVYLVMGSTILTLTTTPNQLTDGLEKSVVSVRIKTEISGIDRVDRSYCLCSVGKLVSPAAVILYPVSGSCLLSCGCASGLLCIDILIAIVQHLLCILIVGALGF